MVGIGNYSIHLKQQRGAKNAVPMHMVATCTWFAFVVAFHCSVFKIITRTIENHMIQI